MPKHVAGLPHVCTLLYLIILHFLVCMYIYIYVCVCVCILHEIRIILRKHRMICTFHTLVASDISHVYGTASSKFCYKFYLYIRKFLRTKAVIS
jgi:hypothetical protein